MIDVIEKAHALFLLHLSEPKDNALQIVVGESSVGQPQDVMIAGRLMEGFSPITHESSNRVFTLTRDSYVTYAAINESWRSAPAG